MSSPKTVKPLHWALFFIFLIGGVALYAQGEGLVGGDYAWLISLSRSFMLLAAIYLFFERLFRMALHYKILLGMVFGALVGIIGCYQGFSTKFGTEAVGMSTTQTVIVVSVMVLLADFALTTMFMPVGSV